MPRVRSAASERRARLVSVLRTPSRRGVLMPTCGGYSLSDLLADLGLFVLLFPLLFVGAMLDPDGFRAAWSGRTAESTAP